MTRPLRVAFTDLWSNATPERSFLLRALRVTTPAEVVEPRDAELLFFSVFGDDHARFVGTKVQYTGENTRPRFDLADFCIGSDFVDDPRYLRYPFFAAAYHNDLWSSPPPEPGPAWSNREFCLFLYSHATRERRQVFEALSRYRPVTSPGAFLHNVDVPDLAPRTGAWRPSKLRYQRNFRFTVAYENSAYPGYTTEKIVDALLAGSIPIYWGNPEIARDIRLECFIHARDFPDLEALVEHVRRVDTDGALADAYRAPGDFFVRPVDQYWDDLVEFLGQAAASVGTTSRATARWRAARASVTTRAARARRWLRRQVREQLGRGESGRVRIPRAAVASCGAVGARAEGSVEDGDDEGDEGSPPRGGFGDPLPSGDEERPQGDAPAR
jgi:hypothetical protein